MTSPEKKPKIWAEEQKIEVLCIYEPISGITEGKKHNLCDGSFPPTLIKCIWRAGGHIIAGLSEDV